MKIIDRIIKRNRYGEAVAIPSVCSAHPDVLAASLILAEQYGLNLLVEATSNQVNQYGGYTGMKPADFINFVYEICDKHQISRDKVIFGGDHLGPQVWKKQPADIAMKEAITLVEAYVKAGFTKIHLDCSEGCAGEDVQVGDDLAASRAAILAKACEAVAADASKIRYIVGTEVPPPGGARADEIDNDIIPTKPEHAQITIEKHQAEFEKLGIGNVWERVIGLVVQPGLEFAPDHVFPFNMTQDNLLSPVLKGHNHLCYEAHSTDYQNANVYTEIAHRNFAIHKVGPALTFAYRKAMYGLSSIEKWVDKANHSDLENVMEAIMLEKPENWQVHYEGDEMRLKLLRHFGYADRIRYYWATDAAQICVSKLLKNLQIKKPILSLLEQYFCQEVIDIAIKLEQAGHHWTQALIYAEIQKALLPYFVVYNIED